MDLSKVHFLIIDDSHETATIVRSLLASWGAQDVHEAATTEAALRALPAANPDIVILDQHLGGDDGLALLRFIRNEGLNPYLPVIVLSADGRPAKVAEARAAGAHEFLVKPFAPRDLYAKLQSVILRPRGFVRAPDYMGPDRRRHADPGYGGPERRKT